MTDPKNVPPSSPKPTNLDFAAALRVVEWITALKGQLDELLRLLRTVVSFNLVSP